MTLMNTAEGGTMVETDELDNWRRHDFLIPPADIDPNVYPRMSNMSAAFIYRAIALPDKPESPEYVTVPMLGRSTKLQVAVSQWNLLWESAQFRRRFFAEEDLPKSIWRFAELGDINVQFVPRTKSRYFEYAVFAHLLPKSTLERFGLPLLRAGQWPFLADLVEPDSLLPHDFEERLARAWGWTVWPSLMSGSAMGAFSSSDPLRLLSHQLDFWLPAVTEVIQARLRDFPQVDNGIEPKPITLIDGSTLTGATASNPRKGGDIWTGESEAADVRAATIEMADRTGRLRAIVDAVKSNRVEDDFSDRWSYAREDFERKLYSKRSKVKVRFVELTDATIVQSSQSEYLDNLATNEFLSILDPANRQIVVLLNSGVTKKTEIAKMLGYANHSPVSKRLARIRLAAAEYFGDR